MLVLLGAALSPSPPTPPDARRKMEIGGSRLMHFRYFDSPTLIEVHMDTHPSQLCKHKQNKTMYFIKTNSYNEKEKREGWLK